MTELEELRLAYAECSRQRNELLTKLKLQAQSEPVAWRYHAVSPFKEDGMYKVSDKWTLIDKPSQRDAHSAVCGMEAEPLYTHPALVQQDERLKNIQDFYNALAEDHSNVLKENALLEEQNKQLLEALRVYATRGNWLSPSTGFAAQYDPIPSVISIDSGNIARAAIAQVEGLK